MSDDKKIYGYGEHIFQIQKQDDRWGLFHVSTKGEVFIPLDDDADIIELALNIAYHTGRTSLKSDLRSLLGI